jgi:flagellar protein FliS
MSFRRNTMNFASAANAYSKVGVETAVGSADPLGLVIMLYDGAILSVNKAMAALRDRNTRVKGESISKAIQIIEGGLRASLDRKAGGAIALQLDALYEYMCRRLLAGSMRNDPAPMAEVARLLADLRESWWALANRPAASREAAPRAARA